HPRAPSEGSPETFSRGGQDHPLPPIVSRPDRPAAQPEGDRRLCRRQLAERLREAGRQAARLAALRRALGPAVARRFALRRQRPLRKRHLPPRPDVLRLSSQGPQQPPALLPLRAPTTRAPPAALPLAVVS